MGITRGRRPLLLLAAAGLAVAVALGGCGSDDGGASTSGAAPVVDAPPPAEGAPALNEPGAERDSAGGGEQAPAQAQDGQAGGAPARFRIDQRSIVYTGTITVRIDRADDIDRVAEQAVAAASGAGGFVGADRRTSNDDHSQAALTLRVPANRFADVVNQLARLGDEESRSIDTDDVTEAVVDLDARIATQEASVSRTRTLLARARTIGEIVAVESELSKREAELASLQAKKRRLDDLTSLSTITLTLLGPLAEVEEDEPDRGFLAGLESGWDAFVISLQVMLTVLGALLPWLIALGVPIFLAVRLARWLAARRRGSPAPATPAE